MSEPYCACWGSTIYYIPEEKMCSRCFREKELKGKWDSDIGNVQRKLDLAIKALEEIASVTTVGYSEARRARKKAQDSLIQLAIPERSSDE